jgi:hypothetical protein
MGQRPRSPSLAGLVGPLTLSAVLLNSCGSTGSSTCLSSDVGEVCADNSDGVVTFRGNGLDPASEVVVRNSKLEDDATFVVDSDGTFEPEPDAVGVVTFVADTMITFTISAVDAEGTPIEGEITVTS